MPCNTRGATSSQRPFAALVCGADLAAQLQVHMQVHHGTASRSQQLTATCSLHTWAADDVASVRPLSRL